MLKKLVKHEYKATARFFLPTYGGFALLLLVQRLSLLWASTMRHDQSFLGQLARIVMNLFSFASVLALIALLLCPMIYGITRFYKNMLSDEGYLSFTLPVTVGQHLISKLLVMLSWQILTFFVAAGCGVLYFLSVHPQDVQEMFSDLGFVFQTILDVKGWGVLVVVLLVLAVLSQITENIMRLYNAMSIGQYSSSHKLLASVAVYIAHNMLLGLLVQIPATIYLIGSQFSTPMTTLVLNSSSSLPVKSCQMLCLFLAGGIVANVVLSTVYFFISRYFLTKKLNLA